MAARTVTVLAPNGRRQTVKCTTNTTILQILEEVCKKQGFEPVEYDIKHHNKALDTSMTVQFSGLPNNAQLELGPASKTREESEVTVALNFEDGRRVVGTFLPSNTLQDILNSLYNSQEPNPVVIYMRRELYGDDLSKTDLRSLGLTGGRAMLRVIHKSPEELKTQANVSSTIPPKPVEEKPYKRVFQPLETPTTVEESVSGKTKNEKQTLEGQNPVPPSSKNVPAKPDILKLAKQERKKSEEKETNLEKSNSEKISKSEKGRTIKKEGRVLGSEKNTPKQNDQNMQEVLDNINIADFPFIGERRGLIFPLESVEARPKEDPPDDFFNLTVEDAKTILRDIRRMREEAEEGGPLITAALRQLEESKKQLRQLSRYSKCIIRVLFPDRMVLQGVFSPTDFVRTVVDFVAENLSNNNIPFYLYTTPPKFTLPVDKRLIEVDCVPGALLHFGVEDQYKNAMLTFIRDDLKNKLTTNSMASLAAFKIREENKKNWESKDNDDEDAGKPIAGCSKESDPTCSQAKRNSNNTTTEKLPKWFKGT